MYMVLEGIRPTERTRAAVLDWVELHADADRLKLVATDWVRDEYGRLLGNLADIQTGETLTDWLLEQGMAERYDHHFMDVVEAMLRSQEPES